MGQEADGWNLGLTDTEKQFQAKGNNYGVKGSFKNIKFKNFTAKQIDFSYIPNQLTINIPFLKWHALESQKTVIVLSKKDDVINIDVDGSALHVKATYSLVSGKLILESCHADIEGDHYQLFKSSEIWPSIKDIQFHQDKTTRLHIQNVQLHPLKCDRLLLDKVPLRYINSRLQDITLSADLTDFNGNFVCLLPGNLSLDGHVETDDQRHMIHFSAEFKRDKRTFLTSKGSLQDFYLLHNAQLKMDCRGDIDLQFFEFLLPDRLKGNVHVAFDAQGPVHHLNMKGQLQLKNGVYEDPQQGIIIHNGRAHVDFQNDKILLREFYVDDHSKEKGSITAHGYYDMGTDKGTIIAKAQNFQPLHYHPIYMRISGPVTVNMTPHLEIKGKLVARNVLVSYEQFKQPYQRFVILDAKNPERKKSPKLTFIKKALIEILIEGTANIKGKMLKSIWTGQLNVKCDKGKWGVLGELLGQKGELLFFGKKLKMRFGKIKFDKKKDPKINIEFETQIVDHTIIASLKGRGQNARSHISSEPIMHTEDAYAYLLFGTKKQSLSNFQTAKLVLAIASVNSDEGGILQKLPSMVDVRQKQQSNGQDEEILRFSQPFGERENTSFSFEKSLTSTPNYISAKLERQINNHIKADIGLVSSDVKKANFGGEFGVSFGKNY